MLKLVLAFIFILCGFFAAGQPYGLQFCSHEVIPEKRTSLHITADGPFHLGQETEISFDLMLQPHHIIYFGYVMRLITTGNQNIDIVYNQRSHSFNFVSGETFSAAVPVDTALLLGGWNHISLRINSNTGKLHYTINRSLAGSGSIAIKPGSDYQLYFGTNSYEGYQTIDIPPMCIKDICIVNDGRLQYSFPLSESEGTTAHDAKQQTKAVVKNAVWIKPRHQHWEQVYAVNTKATASIAFDKRREILYLVAVDSLYTLDLTSMTIQAVRLSTRRDSLPPGNQSIYIPFSDSLYNFYIDSKQVSRFDAAGKRWNKDFTFKDLTIYWQANKFFSPVDTCLYIVAGYGQMQYKNLVQRYHLYNQQWETAKTTGDFFMPRYMAAAGTNEAGDTAYLVGGYGSNTGDQTIHPQFTYDVTLYDVQRRSFHTLFHLKEPARQFCFGNHMIIDAKANAWYALTYPTDRFNSVLQLITGNLNQPSYAVVGDSIPFSYYDIASYADLYYGATSKKLVAITLYNDNNNRSDIKVYTIDFPPGAVTTVPVYTANSKSRIWWFLGSGILLLLGAGAFIVFRKKSPQRIQRRPAAAAPPAAIAPVAISDEPVTTNTADPLVHTSAIYLFGNFEVYNKEGQDITTQFTPLLKELFLLILTHTIRTGKGISQEKLFEILWSNKPPKDAKNNYSVNIAKLKPILEQIGHGHIEKVNGKIQFVAEEHAVPIDYLLFMTILRKQSPDRNDTPALLKILERGSFLNETNYTWLDDIKSDVSNMAVDWLLEHITSRRITDHSDIIRMTNAVFLFDQLNEMALEYKCRALIAQGRYGLALETFQKFEKEYEHSYGEKPGKSFNEISIKDL